MNREIIIRKDKKEDHNILREIFYDIRKSEFDWCDENKISMEDFDISTMGEEIFVAEVKDIIVGFASVWEEDNFVHNLFVKKEYRKLGVGKLLLDEVKRKFGTPLTLKCVKENENAVSFYNKNGWIILNENIDKEGSYYLMSLDN